jgi:hypothetical protein
VRPVPFLFGFFGTTTNIRETYDFNRKLVRIDYVLKNTPTSEVHDFNTGLRYVTDKFRGNCTITTLDNQGFDVTYDGDYITMKDPQSFFDFDSKEYQYSGRVSFIRTLKCNKTYLMRNHFLSVWLVV